MKNDLLELGERIFHLRLLYLPDDVRLSKIIDFSTELTTTEKEFARAFCVMCHAEIEAYFEHLATKKVDAAFIKWEKSKQPSRCLMFLLLSYSFELNLKKRALPKTKNDDGSKKTQFEVLIETSSQVKKSFQDAVDNNHGIKEKHLKTLFGSLGYDFSKIDTILIGDLNSWADDRGGHAHGKPKPFNPKDELARVKRVFLSLEKFSNQIDRL